MTFHYPSDEDQAGDPVAALWRLANDARAQTKGRSPVYSTAAVGGEPTPALRTLCLQKGVPVD